MVLGVAQVSWRVSATVISNRCWMPPAPAEPHVTNPKTPNAHPISGMFCCIPGYGIFDILLTCLRSIEGLEPEKPNVYWAVKRGVRYLTIFDEAVKVSNCFYWIDLRIIMNQGWILQPPTKDPHE